MGLQARCLPLAVEEGRNTGTLYSEREFCFLTKCQKLNSIRKIFSHCSTLSSPFTHLSDNKNANSLFVLVSKHPHYLYFILLHTTYSSNVPP